MPIRRLEKSYTGTTSTIGGDELAASTIPVKPHIQPGVLQPAVYGKLLNGATHSGAYGTPQTQSGGDGHSYYYTDIKGSGPIKDPRIGAYFGSQRHKATSLQLLEQETATHGSNIFSIDGRKWFRAYSTGGGWTAYNDSNGNYLQAASNCTGCYLEITGYFNDINFAITTHSNRCDDIDVLVNGTLSVDGSTTLGGKTTLASPLGGRFLSNASFINGGSTLSASLGTTPQINTVRYEMKTGSGEYVEVHAIELIAQDTTSTANKSKIQFPAQNVVSYGKKFALSAAAHHYDPFNGFTNGTTLHSANVDTATSLGLGTGTTWGAPWAISGSNHIRPLNGGRVVKWVASDGTIKTSVTMMPRNAQSANQSASNEITTASATNTQTINFSDDAIESSLSESAKAFYLREFGNGAANQGQGGTMADASMVTGADNLSFVMDDGLTAGSWRDGRSVIGDDVLINTDGSSMFITFIGTGISLGNSDSQTHATTDDSRFYIDGHEVFRRTASLNSTYTVNEEIKALNLPYGTHVLQWKRVTANSATQRPNRVTIFQPKMPPVPDDACILADYMLMADFVKITTVDSEQKAVSKGCRRLNASRDFLYDDNGSNSLVFQHHHGNTNNHVMDAGQVGSGETLYGQVPSFCTNFVCLTYQNRTRHKIYLDGVNKPHGSGATQDDSTSWGSHGTLTTDTTLGLHTLRFEDNTTYWNMGDIDLAIPIHTSSHYQTFETPYLYELVGGDRNMEQTNLVVTADGKTWDEVTRDTSYIGNMAYMAHRSSGAVDYDTATMLQKFRGKPMGNNNQHHMMQKGWVMAYTRHYCLIDGLYEIMWSDWYIDSAGQLRGSITLNGGANATTNMLSRPGNDDGSASAMATACCCINLKRGDYIQLWGGQWGAATDRVNFYIKRIG